MNNLLKIIGVELSNELIKFSKYNNMNIDDSLRYLLSFSLIEKSEFLKSMKEKRKEISKYLKPEKTAEFMALLEK